MDKPQRPIFTEHRRKRLTLWALTVLGWLVSILGGAQSPSVRQLNQRFHHIGLEALTRVTIALLLGRALQFAKARIRHPRPDWKHGRSLRRRHFLRSLLGARVRHMLKHKDTRTRISQLIAVLRDLDAHARRFAARFRKLRRLWRIVPPIAACAFMSGPPASSPAFSDSS